MAKDKDKGPGFTLSNIMSYVRGNVELPANTNKARTRAYGSKELISAKQRTEILSDAFEATETHNTQQLSQAAIVNIVKNSLTKIGRTRAENRKILQLMPNVERAARLMVATIMSPNDLSRNDIEITFDVEEDIPEAYKTRLGTAATDFFNKKLNLKKSMPSWLYQAGYESGASVFAIVPLRSFEKIEDSSYLGMESFINQVIEPMVQDTLFGFSDGPVRTQKDLIEQEMAGLESLATSVLEFKQVEMQIKDKRPTDTKEVRELIGKFLAQESLSLTDNPNILHASKDAKKTTEKRTNSILKDRYRKIKEEPIVSMSSGTTTDEEGELGVVGNPIFMRLPPESVTVIHTPGDPTDHQGYLILLDRQGNPVDTVVDEANLPSNTMNYNQIQGDVFNQVYTAYGFTSRGTHVQSNEEMMGQVYNHVVTEHLRRRIGKAGYSNVEISNIDGVMRCMFARFLERKQTRVLFMPKALITYMAFELDQYGYGVSRLEKIKFNLGMKMAVQISRIMAAIKAAMDKRRIEVTLTEHMLESPETVINSITQEYLRKSGLSFSVDPNVIQNQIADKSLSIKVNGIPGMETFDLTNEPDQKTGSFDFDPGITEELDNEIINGLGVPHAALNSLSEDEYARSVSTTNIFFSMNVGIDQDSAKKSVSDLIQKYATYSEEFHNEIYEIFPSLKTHGTKGDTSSLDDNIVKDTDNDKETKDFTLPKYYTIDRLIESMHITLPSPNIAPSKAQFESIDGMIQSITTVVNALFPDDLMGPDEQLAPTIRALRARFMAVNIRNFLDSSGMSTIEVPESDFSEYLADTGKLIEALQNVDAMLRDKTKIGKPADQQGDLTMGSSPAGF